MNNRLNALIHAVGDALITNKDYLSALDQAIGDGDHGTNMARGFEAVQAKLAAQEIVDIGAALKLTGMTLISTVGGAAGPLYGTAFLRAAAPAAGKTELDQETAAAMLAAAIAGIKERGKAHQGEKTMLDALEPAYEAFLAATAAKKDWAECLELASGAALKGVEYTKTIIATKGRASYLGERSLGHQDPGATSAYIMLTAASDFFRSAQS